MNIRKIDKKIFDGIFTQNLQEKMPCFVFVNDFFTAKKRLKELDIHIIDEYLFIRIFYCMVSKREIFELSDMANVSYISSNQEATSLMYLSKKILSVEKTKLTGTGVGVAFIDTGIDFHADFVFGKNRICDFVDFVGGRKTAYDDNGHGTFVSGVCCGNGALSACKNSGIAPRAKIFALKALNSNGEAGANKILSAMEWIYDNHKSKGIKVACMSFGSEPIGNGDPIMIGAEALWDDGVVVVSAAGNSGPQRQSIKSPGVSSKIITVGGIDDNRFDENSYNKSYFEIANFSSRGPAYERPKPDVVAPGVDIKSCGLNWSYKTLSGTSVATPMIAGLCALMLESNHEAKPQQIKRELLRICQPLGFDKNFEGYGLPNFEKFLVR